MGSIIKIFKKYLIPLIEFYILSILYLFVVRMQIDEVIREFRGESIGLQTISANALDILLLVGLLSAFICNFIFYSALKKKYHFEINVFLYGAGFMACCVVFVDFQTEFPFWLLYILPFTALYYSYAALLQNNDNKITLYLPIITLISFAILIVFEIIKYQIPYVGIPLFLFGLYLAYCLINDNKIRLYLSVITLISFAVLIILAVIKSQMIGISLFLFGSYLVYCLNYKKGRLPLRLFAWSMFLQPYFIILIYLVTNTTPF